jgi:putative colanic acid biosynthesis UDP-glucose lipid carrier transferase
MNTNSYKALFGSLTNFVYRLSDMAALLIAGYIAFFAYLPEPDPLFERYTIAMLFTTLIMLYVSRERKLYEIARGSKPTEYVQELITSHLITFGLILLSAFFFKASEDFSRVWIGLWFASSLLLRFALRAVIWSVAANLHRKGYNSQRILIVGTGSNAQRVFESFQQRPRLGYEVIGFYQVDDLESDEAITSFNELPVFNDIKAIGQHAYEQKVNQIWVATSASDYAKLPEVLNETQKTSCLIRYVPDNMGTRLFEHTVSSVAGLSVINLNFSPLLKPSNQLIKAVEDRVLALLILIGISPVMLAVALAVKLTSKGPVFYRQERVGWNGQTFEILKFRSMAVDSEAEGVQWGGAASMKVTKIGAFIRRTSLDELPQFINVLKGEMSIVGPRPERPMFVDQFKHEIPGYMQKHLVKAGITGWAQTNGWRGDTDLSKRIEYDLFYIENWSLVLDIRIVLLTIFGGFRERQQ